MDNQANVVGARPGDAERPRESDVAALGRGGRMSRQRKTAAVLRLLRGEDLETVSRALGVTSFTVITCRHSMDTPFHKFRPLPRTALPASQSYEDLAQRSPPYG